MTALKQSPEWQALEASAARIENITISACLKDSARTDALMLPLGDALFDCSKNLVDADTLKNLLALARARDVEGQLARMMAGDAVNTTEGRAAWHTALRATVPPPEVAASLAAMEKLSKGIRANPAITDVVHIGIGGSDLGPRMVCEALAGLHDGPRLHFVANVDPDDLDPVLMALDPASTFITIASKTFTTQETMLNAKAARMWLKGRDAQMAAITANAHAAREAGVDEAHILPVWDWVCGRFSVTSAVGLPIAIAFGFDVFKAFLDGCRAADTHAATAPPDKNIPVLLALLTVWYRSFLGCPAQAVVPYSQRLAQWPAYVQQLGMESNGKGVDRDGCAVGYATAPVIFGQVGSNAQHSFFQMLHQGPDIIPVTFIGAAAPYGCPARHKVLMANMLAQGRALMLGRSGAPAAACPGNRPSTTIILPKIDAYNLGVLLAVHEHKAAIEGFLWHLNPFDQFGVELGKALAKELLAASSNIEQNEALDSSTNKLIFHTFRAK